MRKYFVVILAIISGCTYKHKEIKLSDPDYLMLVDSIKIRVDSSTYPYSKNIHYHDSILLIQNEGSWLISFFNLAGKKVGKLNSIVLQEGIDISP